MTRALTLRREALSELDADDLAGVAGAQPDYSGQGLTCPLTWCLDGFTMYPRCV